jgi:hypothetical protein
MQPARKAKTDKPKVPAKIEGKARAKPESTFAVQDTQLGEYIEEVNSSTLISILRRTTKTSWKLNFTTPDGSAAIGCAIAPEFGVVPHGIDNQIVPILLSLYVSQGAPEDGMVRFTISEICSHLGGDVGAKRYDTIRTSLRRLRGAIYDFERSWKLPNGKYGSRSTFSYIVRLEESEMVVGSIKTVVYHAQLDKPLIDNIKNDAIVRFDLSLFLSLSSSHGYGLLRFLESRRRKDQPFLDFNVRHLGAALHTYQTQPAEIMASLEVGHKELLGVGYLADVKVDKHNISYVFKHKNSLEEKILLVLLQLKFSREKALSIISEYGTQNIYNALEVLKQQQAMKQIRNPAGYLLTLLQERKGVEVISPEAKKPKTNAEPNLEIEKAFSELSPVEQQEHFLRSRKVLFVKCTDNEFWQLLTMVQMNQTTLAEIYLNALELRTPEKISVWVKGFVA